MVSNSDIIKNIAALEFILLCYSGTNRLYMSRWVEALLFLRFKEVHAQKLEKRKRVSRS